MHISSPFGVKAAQNAIKCWPAWMKMQRASQCCPHGLWVNVVAVSAASTVAAIVDVVVGVVDAVASEVVVYY